MILILCTDLDMSTETEWRCKLGTEEEKWTFVMKYMKSNKLDLEWALGTTAAIVSQGHRTKMKASYKTSKA